MAFLKSKRSKVMVVLGAIGLLCFIIGCVLIGTSDTMIHSKVSARMPLSKKGNIYNQWKQPKGPLFFQVWVFDVMNAEGILKGEKPVVTQLGPFTYRDERLKHDIQFSDDGTVSYKEKSTYIFEKDLSVRPDSETVTVANLAMASIMSLLRYEEPEIKTMMNEIFKAANQSLFMEVSVHDLIWGYKDVLLEQLAPLAALKNITLPPNNTIGLFTGKNDTDSEVFVVYSGLKSLNNLAEIVSWKGQKKLSLWTSDYANTMNGSLGTLYPPFVKKEKQHSFFSTDLTRTLSLDFQKEVNAHGIELYNFVVPSDNFANVTINPNNAGFCTPAGNCLPSGLLNISNSHYGAPIVASCPHFLFCDDNIKDSIEGIHPNKQNHQSHVNLEPLTGVNMDFAIKIQVNIHLDKIDGFKLTDNLASTFMPTAWFNENAKITEKQANDFKNQVLSMITVLKVIKYVFLGMGSLLLVSAASIPLVVKLREQKASEEDKGSIQKANLAKWRAHHASTNSATSDNEAEPLLSTSTASASE